MAVPQIKESLTPEQTRLVALMQAKAHDLSDTEQVPDIELGVAYRDLEASVPEVILTAPKSAVSELGVRNQFNLNQEDTGSVLVCPSGFLRCLKVRADTWYRWLTVVSEEDSDAHIFQSIPFTNATPYRPLAVYRPGVGAGTLKLYPDALTAQMEWVALVAPEALPSLLIEPLCWLALSKYMEVDEPGLSQAAKAQYQETRNALINRGSYAVQTAQ